MVGLSYLVVTTVGTGDKDSGWRGWVSAVPEPPVEALDVGEDALPVGLDHHHLERNGLI